jgi:endo-1,4-beta-xylanase
VFAFLIIGSSCEKKSDCDTTSLKNALADKFFIGVALNEWQTDGLDSLVNATTVNNFSSIVAENCMKSESLQPEEGVFTFDKADEFVEYGEANNMFIIGHCLIWHAQAPHWFFTDIEGNDVSREVMIERVRTHISTVVGRYKGRVNGWDVVNEAFNEDGSLRNSKFLQIIGDDYIELAFQFAHEADPDAQLYYNDYNMWKPEKCKNVIQFFSDLKANGLKIDGVGLQAHIGLSEPTIEQYQISIDAIAEMGVKAMFTELDVSVLPFPSEQITADISTNFELKQEYDPYAEGIPDSVSNILDKRYVEIFDLFIKNSEKISRVTFWGLSDANTWRNNWPINGRTDYPLLFDRKYQAKPAVQSIVELLKEN